MAPTTQTSVPRSPSYGQPPAEVDAIFAGVSVRKDCVNKTDCAVWLGSGSVWKLLKQHANASDPQDDEWVMNYSQEVACLD